MTLEWTADELLDALFLRRPARPEDLGAVFGRLRALGLSFEDKRYVLLLWLDRAGVPPARWMFERLKQAPALEEVE